MRKVDWARVGRVTEPGRYMMRFGYVIVTADDLDIWKNFYAAMGRRKVDNDDYLGSLIGSGLFLFGTVDEIRAELIEQWTVFPAEYITLINHYAQTPADVVIEQLDLFQNQVKPALDEIIHHANRAAA